MLLSVLPVVVSVAFPIMVLLWSIVLATLSDTADTPVDVIVPASVTLLDSREMPANPIPRAVPLAAEAIAVPLILKVDPVTVNAPET